MNTSPPPILIMEFRRRKVWVNRPLTYEDALILAQSTFPSLHATPIEDIVLMAEIREYSDHGNVEISRETWNVLRSSFACVTVAFKRERLALE